VGVLPSRGRVVDMLSHNEIQSSHGIFPYKNDCYGWASAQQPEQNLLDLVAAMLLLRSD